MIYCSSKQAIFTTDCSGYLKQFSVENLSLEKNYGQVHNRKIVDSTMSNDEKSLFTIDNDGCVKQWNLSKQKLEQDWGKIHEGNVNIARLL